MSDAEGQGPQPPQGEDDIERFLDRFATREARVILIVTKWVLYVAVAAIGIEVVVAFLEDFPKLYFVTVVLDMLGKFILVCDAIVFVVFLIVATLLAINTLLKLIGIDVIAGVRSVLRRIGTSQGARVELGPTVRHPAPAKQGRHPRLIVAVAATFFIVATSSWWVACKLRVFEVCYGPFKFSAPSDAKSGVPITRNAFSATQSVNTLPHSLGGTRILNLDNVATLSLGVPSSMNMVTLFLGPAITYPNIQIPGGSIEDQKFMYIEQTYVFELMKTRRREVVVAGRTFIVTLLEIKRLDETRVANPIEYVFGISEK
jgi:hypothetical protein